jgi:hypothetical protein
MYGKDKNALAMAHAPARARARIEAERLDDATVRSLIGWLRHIAAMYPPRRRKRLEADAAFIEAHNTRVEARLLAHCWSVTKPGS